MTFPCFKSPARVPAPLCPTGLHSVSFNQHKLIVIIIMIISHLLIEMNDSNKQSTLTKVKNSLTGNCGTW